MKNKMPLDGLGLGHDSGSVHCDMLKMLCFRTAWGRGLMNAPVPCSPQGVTSGTAWSGWSPPLRGGGRG